MTPTDKQLFSRLKAAISEQLRNNYPDVPEDTSSWKKREIALFQQALLDKVHGRISEKWFYTHIKAEHRRLPRIDMLDLLSRYTGEPGWASFKKKNQSRNVKTKYSLFIAIASIFILVITGIALSMKPNTVQFCFHDLYSQQPIPAKELNVSWHRSDESPMVADVNSAGCVCIQSNEPVITLQVSSPYYLEETITRKVEGANYKEGIALRTDDYTRAIRMFSQYDQQEWKHCRSYLRSVFKENARIYHYNSNETFAVAILNRDEFIDKLTSPTRALKNLEVMDVDYEDNKITVLRFKVKAS